MMATRANRIFLTVMIDSAGFGIGTRSEATPAPCSFLTIAEGETVDRL